MAYPRPIQRNQFRAAKADEAGARRTEQVPFRKSAERWTEHNARPAEVVLNPCLRPAHLTQRPFFGHCRKRIVRQRVSAYLKACTKRTNLAGRYDAPACRAGDVE